jgi:hypothetical protein
VPVHRRAGTREGRTPRGGGIYGFAQCRDEKGWFWKPAQAATERLKLLDFDAILSE